MLVLAKTVEALDRRVAVGAILPFAGRAPLELRGLRGIGERFACGEQRFDVDAVVGLYFGSHNYPPYLALGVMG